MEMNTHSEKGTDVSQEGMDELSRVNLPQEPEYPRH